MPSARKTRCDTGKGRPHIPFEKDLKNKIDYYLTHEDERKEIVGKGKKIVLRNHTFDARAKEISYDLENKKE